MTISLPTLDLSTFSPVLYSEQIRKAEYTNGVTFETNDEDGDVLYLNIEGDSISDLFYVIEVTQSGESKFLLKVNLSKFSFGIITGDLEEAVEKGKIWAKDKDLIRILETMRLSPKEFAQVIDDKLAHSTPILEDKNTLH